MDLHPLKHGSEELFWGTVRVETLFSVSEPARVSLASVTFEPRARTARNNHALGQHLIVSAGTGWIQKRGGPVEEMRQGDVVWIYPGEKHWHAALPTTSVMHNAFQ